MKLNNTRGYIAALAIGISSFGLPAQAQETRNLGLDEAIELSLKNSNEIKLNQAKIMESSASLREAKERRLPDFSIQGSYMRLNQPDIDLKVKLGGSSQQQSGETGTGGTGSTAASSPKVNEVMYGMATVSLPVFAGFKIQHGIEAAKYLANAVKLDAEKDRDEVIANTIMAYSNMYKAKAALDIVKENLKQSKQRVADFTNLEKNGLMARNDLLKAQLQQSNVELSLLDAENNWKITYINMNLMLGLPEETELVPDAASFVQVTDTRSFEDWQQIALENRKDIAAIDMRRQAAQAGVKVTKGDYYPSLALTGGLIAAHIPNFLTINNAVNAGVGLKYSPSSLWKTGSKVAQARAQVAQADISRNMLTDGIRLQTAQAYQSYLSNQKKIDVYAKAVEQANENYRILKNKYDNSLATTTDLLDADVAQLQANINYAFAKADAVVSYKKLQQMAGVLGNQKTNENE